MKAYKGKDKWEFGVSVNVYASTLRELKEKAIKVMNRGEISCLVSSDEELGTYDSRDYEVTSITIKKKKIVKNKKEEKS